MTLANMRSLGVRSVDTCCGCGRESIIDVSALEGSHDVPSLRLRLRCSACGGRPAFVRPNWLEMRARGMSRADDV
jgi:hypothetical protein